MYDLALAFRLHSVGEVTKQPLQIIKYPLWQGTVEAARSEPDHNRLLQRVHTAEVAIFNRLRELGQHPEHPEHASSQAERLAIADACKVLLDLKRDKLGFPDWETKR